MTDSTSASNQSSEDHLAELERSAERRDAVATAPDDSTLPFDHRRLYSLIDELCAPIRIAVTDTATPPEIPEYDELSEIGRGGMGIVYAGRHKRTRRTDAIKVIRPDRLVAGLPGTMAQMRVRFERESQLAARVAHEHIVPVYQVGETDGCSWYSMQLVDGTSLYDLCRENPLSVERAARYIERVARALDTVHRHGILHGDIKPHNILIERETDRPMLSDFGLGDLIASESTNTTNSVAGTLSYLAPELVQAAKNASGTDVSAVRSVSSDVYSLGTTLLFALTGRSPSLNQADTREKQTDLPTGHTGVGRIQTLVVPISLLRICMRCQALDPNDRYHSAAEMADDLLKWINRPAWNQHFPRLRSVLVKVLAPVLVFNGVAVWWLSSQGAAEGWSWLIMFSGYAPLFFTILASQQPGRETDRARRELWSIWLGNMAGSLACFVALRILCHPDPLRTLAVVYPCWAAISAVTFFAKSGNFWSGYRWVGIAWSALTIMLALVPAYSTMIFGICSAVTCVVIARCDEAFDK